MDCDPYRHKGEAYCRPHMATSDMAAIAGERAIKNAGLSVEDIELIIVATATPDNNVPSAACLVQNKLGAIRAAAFDIGAACSGFYGVVTANNLLKPVFIIISW